MDNISSSCEGRDLMTSGGWTEKDIRHAADFALDILRKRTESDVSAWNSVRTAAFEAYQAIRKNAPTSILSRLTRGFVKSRWVIGERVFIDLDTGKLLGEDKDLILLCLDPSRVSPQEAIRDIANWRLEYEPPEEGMSLLAPVPAVA